MPVIPKTTLIIKTGSNGKVSGDGITGQQSGTLTFQYDVGTIIRLYPHPNAGYYFNGFSYSGAVDAYYDLTNQGKSFKIRRDLAGTNATITLSFQPYYIKVVPNGGLVNAYDASSPSSEYHGVDCTATTIIPIVPVSFPINYRFTATPPSGYSFSSFSYQSAVSSGTVTTNPALLSITESSKYLIITANYSAAPYSVSLSVSPSNTGVVSGAGAYSYGSSYTIKATPYSGYRFKNWTYTNGQVAPAGANATWTGTLTGNVSFVANFEEAHSNEIVENSKWESEYWRDGFTTEWDNHQLRSHITQINTGADISNSLWSWYRFFYRARGYENSSDNPVVVDWCLVFMPTNTSANNPNPIVNNSYIHTKLNVSCKDGFVYGLTSDDTTQLTTNQPTNFSPANSSGTIRGRDVIEAMVSPKNAAGWGQITCRGEIPIDEVDRTKNKIAIEFSRISYGMLSQISNTAWYDSQLGSGMTGSTDSIWNMYKSNDDRLYNKSNGPLIPSAPTLSSVVSYHQKNVVATTDSDAYVMFRFQNDEEWLPESGNPVWFKKTATLGEVTDDYIFDGKLKVVSNYWINKWSNNVLYSACDAFYGYARPTVQFAPQNVISTFNQDSATQVSISFNKLVPQGNNGYFNLVRAMVGGEIKKEISVSVYDSNQTITLQKEELFGEDNPGEFSIVCCCDDGNGIIHEGQEIEFVFDQKGAIIKTAYVLSPNNSYFGNYEPNCVVYKDQSGDAICDIVMQVNFDLIKDSPTDDWSNYIFSINQVGGQFSQYCVLQSSATGKLKFKNVNLNYGTRFRLYTRKLDWSVVSVREIDLNAEIMDYVDYSGISLNGLIDYSVSQNLLQQAFHSAKNYCYLCSLLGGVPGVPGYPSFIPQEEIEQLENDLTVGKDELVVAELYARVLEFMILVYYILYEDYASVIQQTTFIYPGASIYPSSTLFPGGDTEFGSEIIFKAGYIEHFIRQFIENHTLYVLSQDVDENNNTLISNLVDGVLHILWKLPNNLIIADDYDPDDVEQTETLNVMQNYQKAMLYIMYNMF